MDEDLIKDIEQNKSEEVRYRHKQLDLFQCQRIGNGLKHNTVLTYLSLRDNEIGPGAKYIASALHVNTTLDSLILSSNNIGDTEAKDLAAALHVNTALETLFLGANNIGDPGAKDFGEALQVNTALVCLNLFNNNISNKGGNYLLKAFDNNRTLTKIDLSFNNIQEALSERIRAKAKANERTPGKLKAGLKSEVGKILHGNGFTELVVPFYDNNIHSIEQASELSRVELKTIGNFSLAERKVLRELFIPEYKKTPLGYMLVDSGLEEYAKMFYDDGVYDTTAHTLTTEDLKDVGVNNPEHLKNLLALFNGNPAPVMAVKPKTITTQQQLSKKFSGFISHYKKEAGTTARIMKLMIKLDKNYSEAEVFLDSDDLDDLDELLNHVRQSGALIVILTKDYFTRPWCLAELVAAWKHQPRVPFVSCRLVGVNQEFDVSSFPSLIENYKDLTNESGWDVLNKKGFTKEDVRDAIERLSMIIARKFEPNESEPAQRVQLNRILKDLAERSTATEFSDID